jgi:hypothetical protein
MIRNLKLSKSFCAAIENSIEILGRFFNEYIPSYKGKTYERYFRLETSQPRQRFTSLFFGNLISEKRTEIEKLPEFEEFLKLIKSDTAAITVSSEVFLWGANLGKAIDQFYGILEKVI